MKRFVIDSVVLLGMLVCAAAADAAVSSQPSGLEKPFNRIVIVLDASGSYRGRQSDAVAKATSLLDQVAARKSKRWEKADEVVIISLDAIPEAIWKGSPLDLSGAKPTEWKQRFNARSDYAGCTDVNRAFQLAADILETEPRPSEKYLFVFSDLIHEPPLASARKCRTPQRPSVPETDFPWDRFADVGVAVFWMPVEQKLAWGRVIAEQGMERNFRLYTTSESHQAEASAPPAAKRKVSATEAADLRATVIAKGTSFFSWALYGVLGCLAFFGIAFLVGRLRGGRFAGKPAGGTSGSRRVAGPVPRMNVAARSVSPLTRPSGMSKEK